MENLLAMPLRPMEVMIGKILPYIIVGYVQILLILCLAKFLFGVPMLGSIVCSYSSAYHLLLQIWLWD